MRLFQKRQKYKITCSECHYTWISKKSPKGSMFNKEPDRCPECNHCGGYVTYAD